MTEVQQRRRASLGVLRLAAAVLAAALAGCAVGPNYVKPATPVAQHFTGAAAGSVFGRGRAGTVLDALRR